MNFATPVVLIALVVPALLAWWVWRRRGVAVAVAADHVDGLAPRHGWWRGLLRLMDLMPVAFIAVVVVLMAGPQQPAPPEEKRTLTNIEFCLDVSGSMNSQMPTGESRYEAAMDAIELFAEARSGDAFGLTIFGNEVLRWLPLTTDIDALAKSRQWLDPAELPDQFGGTSIGKGLRSCIGTLSQRGDGDRMIILLSDGISSDLRGDVAPAIASEMAAANIQFFMVYIGRGGPQPEIYNFASATNGEIFSANDNAGLMHCFAAIDQLNPVEVEKMEAGMRPQRKPWLLVLAGLAMIHFVGLLGVRRTPW